MSSHQSRVLAISVVVFTVAYCQVSHGDTVSNSASKGSIEDLIRKTADCNQAVKSIGELVDRTECRTSAAKEKSIEDILKESGIDTSLQPSEEDLAPLGSDPGPKYPMAVIKDLNGDDLHLSVLTPEQVMELHQKMAKLDWRLRFHIPDDGCRARATIMTRTLLDKEGVVSGKVWTEPGWFSKIGTNLPNRRGGVDYWKYHVAPFVLVKRDGKIQVEVIDPSISKTRPLALDAYQMLLSDTPQRNRVRFSNMYPYDPTEKYEVMKGPRPNDWGRAWQELEEMPARIGKQR